MQKAISFIMLQLFLLKDMIIDMIIEFLFGIWVKTKRKVLIWMKKVEQSKKFNFFLVYNESNDESNNESNDESNDEI